jgi:protein arginine kinase
MTENNNLHSFFCQFKLWAKNSNPIWLASTVRLFRNIEKFKFPVKLDGDRRKQIVSLLSKEFMSMEQLKNPSLFKAEDLSSLEKEYLVEHFLSNQSFHSAGPGEAFIIDSSGEKMISLNLRNHVHFESIDTNSELETTWNQLVMIETALGKNISYSYSPKFGFLTADPTQCGTGLSVTIFLQLSGLIHMEMIDGILEKMVDESFVVTGIQGSPTEIIGDVIVIQNNYTLGVTEENIISSIRSIATKLLVEEHAIRFQIKNKSSPEIKDKISRAFGILIHSYQIEAVEALNAISLLKLGVDLGWLEGINMIQLNELFFNCRRAHLLCQYEDKIPQEEVQHKRAEFIHKTLKEAKLII